MKVTKLFLSALAAIAAISSAAVTAGAAGVKTERVSVTQSAAASSGVNVTYRTPEEIRSYISSHPFSTSDYPTYGREPDMTSPYTDPGALSSVTLQNGLNTLNFMRYVAGLPEVTLNSEYSELCQHGSYISALNGTISHSPSQPDGVSDSLYEKGAQACGSSNLAMGYTNLSHSIMGYMYDSDIYNIDRLGHRRWCLNPSMQQTGFGQVNRCQSMYAFDNTFGDTPLSGVCWPAQNMPVEYFGSGYAWSYSLGTRISDPDNVKVKLTRKSDGKVWNFSNASADGYFNVENSNYGKPGCVIFCPSDIDEYEIGDVFTVHMDGVGTAVDYTVNFFSMDVPPSAVTGLSASPSTDSVYLTWDKNSAADSYQIDIYQSGMWSYLAKTTGNSFTVTGLTPNTSYKFRIFAFKGSQHSSSTSVSTTTKAAASTKPSAVTGLSASPSTNSVKLTWNKNSTADSYQVDVYKNGAWTYLTKTTGTSYTATGLTANTSYKFRVFAFKGSQYSSSTSVSATTNAAASTKPSAVTGFSASPSTYSVKLTWNKNSTADSYQVDVYKNGKWTYLTKTTGTSYTVTGLTAGTSYKFRIFAFKGSQYSSSASLTATTKAAPSSKPSAVTGFSASPSTNSVRLTWNRNSTADSYQVDVYKNGKWTYLTKTTSTSYTATGLSAGTSYKFRIFAFKGSQYSSSASLTATTKAAASSKPSAVTGFSASPSTNSVKLTWNKNSAADSYQIDVYKNGKWTYLTKTTGTSYTATGLTAGTSYKFRIFAFKGTSYSSSASLTASTKPAAVTSLTAAPSSTSVRLSWRASSGADSYQVDMYKNGKWVYVGKTTGTSYNVTGLSSGYIYNFRVFAFKDTSYSSSTSIRITTG